jgi:hypothetical protein
MPSVRSALPAETAPPAVAMAWRVAQSAAHVCALTSDCGVSLCEVLDWVGSFLLELDVVVLWRVVVGAMRVQARSRCWLCRSAGLQEVEGKRKNSLLATLTLCAL